MSEMKTSPDLLVVDNIQTFIGQFHILEAYPCPYRKGRSQLSLGGMGPVKPQH
jgi:hypothetical protein